MFLSRKTKKSARLLCQCVHTRDAAVRITTQAQCGMIVTAVRLVHANRGSPSQYKDSPSNLMDFLRNRDFTKYIYAGAVNAVKHASTFGTPIIVSDGDAVRLRP